MTAHPATTQFEMLAAVAPLPTARLEFPAGATADPRKEWNAARKAFQRGLLTWRSSFLGHLAAMRSALEQSVEEIGPEKAGRIAADGTAAMRKVIADNVALARGWLDIFPETDRRDELAALIAGIPDIQHQYRQAVQRLIDMLIEADDRLYALELDFDPDAHGTGPTFDNADDLIAYLRS